MWNSDWHTTKYGDPYSELCSAFTHPKCTHTAVNIHTTVNTHPEQWAAIYGGAQGALGGSVPCSRDLSRGIEGEESAGHSPPPQFLPARDSDSQPLDYESNSLTIRPRLWLQCECIEKLNKQNWNSTECIERMNFMKLEKHLEICGKNYSIDRQTDRQTDR